MVVAFPPCTHLAVSGAAHFAAKRADGRQQEGIDFFMQFTKLDHVPKVANPIRSFNHTNSEKTLQREPVYGSRDFLF